MTAFDYLRLIDGAFVSTVFGQGYSLLFFFSKEEEEGGGYIQFDHLLATIC
jgi:hypothetical protein